MNRAVLPSPWSMPMLLAVACLLGGCGGSGGDPAPDVRPVGADAVDGTSDPVFADPLADASSSPTELPAPLRLIEADPGRVAEVPALVGVETLADSGLQVAYTDVDQRTRVAPLQVGVQWQHMQRCTGVVAPAPLVLVRDTVEPFGPRDDVIRDIEGRIVASATELVGGVAILQVGISPFDGNRADAGFGLLRQIMGRHLWFSAGLQERFYPSECARETPAADTTFDTIWPET